LSLSRGFASLAVVETADSSRDVTTNAITHSAACMH
jgi:hypothetical protein